mmetsp:Transcript_7987/g.8814  ORF Transcript_7987/g.8814 Transcript_7987/m.8814 type:complete len:193 (+) Transcript_7987:101-679(+)
MGAIATKATNVPRITLLELPVEIQYMICEMDCATHVIWPLLSKQTALSSRYNTNLLKHGKFIGVTPVDKDPRNNEVCYGVCQLGTLLRGFQPRKLGNFKHGKKHGVFKHWNDKGQIVLHVTYHENLPEGNCTHFHENGSVRSRSFFKDGRQDGTTTHYYPNGKVQYLIEYNKGEPVRHHRWSSSTWTKLMNF